MEKDENTHDEHIFRIFFHRYKLNWLQCAYSALKKLSNLIVIAKKANIAFNMNESEQIAHFE